MKVNEFVEEYTQVNNKDKFIEKHILSDKYIPYVEKITRCKNIINATMYTELKGESIFRKNSTSQYLLYTLTLIDLYTDIDIDFAKTFDEYDALEKYALVTPIIANINANELQTWESVSEMLVNDILENTRSITGWLDNKMDVLGLLFNSLSDAEADVISK